jgi:glycerol-3-phosphate O-acyltransferase
VERRNGRVAFFEGECWPNIIDRALYHLRKVVHEQRENVTYPFSRKNADLQDMILLAKYRNNVLNIFLEEAVIATAFYSFGSQYLETKASRSDILQKCQFLFFLLHEEISCIPHLDTLDVNRSLDKMIARGVFMNSPENLIQVNPKGDTMFVFLCSMCWPLVDCYYVVACALYKLKSSRTMQDILLLSESQTLGVVSLYSDFHSKFIKPTFRDCSAKILFAFTKVLLETL